MPEVFPTSATLICTQHFSEVSCAALPYVSKMPINTHSYKTVHPQRYGRPTDTDHSALQRHSHMDWSAGPTWVFMHLLLHTVPISMQADGPLLQGSASLPYRGHSNSQNSASSSSPYPPLILLAHRWKTHCGRVKAATSISTPFLPPFIGQELGSRPVRDALQRGRTAPPSPQRLRWPPRCQPGLHPAAGPAGPT